MPRADSRGVQCCAEVRAILGCDAVSPCRGFKGDCGDIAAQFLDVQGPYTYDGEAHVYVDEYVCHAFPDEESYWDQLLVGLISVAVALPIDMLLQRAFEVANEGELPGNWLCALSGKWKLLLGKRAHNGWRFADPDTPVSEFVLWLTAGGDESDFQAVLFLCGYALRRLRAVLFGDDDAEDEQQRRAEAWDDDNCKAPTRSGGHPEFPDDPLEAQSAQEVFGRASGKQSGSSRPSSSSGSEEARAETLIKRLYASAGLLGVYACWLIFCWVIFVRAIGVFVVRAGEVCSRISAVCAMLNRDARCCRSATENRRMECSSTPSWAPARKTSSPRRGASAMRWRTRQSGRMLR
jgi:hypothetical protein